MARLPIGVFGICCAISVFATGASSQPTASQLRNVAEAAGAAAAGFSVCGDSSKARRIKSKFKNVADACTSSKSAMNEAMNSFDLEYANTLNAVAKSGGTCKGMNETRFDTIIDTLERAEDSC